MQNNNELTLTVATHSAINVLHFYHTSSTYNTRNVANVNTKIHMNIPAPKYNWAIRNGPSMEFNNYIKDSYNFKTQSGPYYTDYLIVMIRAF